MNCDLSNEPRLAFHRDLFLFHTCIGCRVSGLWNMIKESMTGNVVDYFVGEGINGDEGMLSGHKSDCKTFDCYWTPDDDIRQSLVGLLV